MEDRPEPTPDDHTLPLGGTAPPTSGSPAVARPSVPDSVGAYPVVRELGRGGMGVVYLARDVRLERDIALKMLPAELDSDSELRKRFLAEARTLAALNHPNIATIYSLEDSGERHFLTMELVQGQSMWERLRGGALPTDETLLLMRQVARAVEAAHSKGVVHRDLKPSTVMLQDDGTVKVLDFGLAIRLQGESLEPGGPVPGAGEVAGTPGYMSPEQIRGEAANPSTDVWAVGCLLYECLCGRPLIVGRNVAEKLAVTMTMDVGPALEAARLGADLSARLSLLLKRCLAASAEERPASMHDVRLLLEEEIADRALPRAAEDRPVAPEAQAAPGNLPWSLTSFVGRAHDLAETVRLMDEHRMVTITGAGGCGKTRLSLEIARRKREACPDGAWWVELASLSDSALVPATAAAALNVQQTPGATALDTLLRFLGDQSVLLILDNCEHLVDACADLAERVLKACPRVRILATSRESLRVEGEAVYSLAPLALPKPGSSSRTPSSHERLGSGSVGPYSPRPTLARPGSASDGEDSDAVLLFVARARAVFLGFQLDETIRAAVHEICRRLDGIPLAIELAAARVKTLPVGKIRDLLDNRFRLLTRTSRSAQPHQSTLRALIDWSYDRLDAREQVARVRCAACRAEFLVAFRCKGRGFCPSCQSRRLAEWSLWLDEQLLAPVAHRHVVLTIPKWLRAYIICDRRQLGLLSRVAYRTLHGYVCAALGEPDAVPGVVSLAQSFGSLGHWHSHLHVVVNDGAFRRDGRFVRQTAHDAAVLAEAWRRAVLALFVREYWLEEDAAASMLAWPHSGFSAYVRPAIAT